MSYSHLQSIDGQVGLHPRIHRVPHDSVAEHVLNRTQIQLSFARVVLGNIGQPQLVGLVSGEVPLHQVVMHRRARRDVLALAFADH